MDIDNIHICCPKCHWEPDGKPYWQCSCGHIWDTFSTAARCPACGKQWEYTQCISYAGGCNATSPHLQWYQGLDDIIESLTAELLQRSDQTTQ